VTPKTVGRGRLVVVGAGLAVAAAAVAVIGLTLIDRKSADPRSARVIPPALDRIASALPPGSTLVEKSLAITPESYKTVGRIIFVSPLPGARTREALLASLGWHQCGDTIVRSNPCDSSPGPEDVIAGVQSAVKTSSPSDQAGTLLGGDAARFPAGSVVVEVRIGVA
jgi:hypothetical protein